MLFQQWREIMVDGVGPGACTGMMGSRGEGKLGSNSGVVTCGEATGRQLISPSSWIDNSGVRLPAAHVKDTDQS